MPKITATELASLSNGTLHGNGAVEINSVNSLEMATPGSVTFFAPKSKKKAGELEKLLRTTSASAVFVAEYLPDLSTTQIVVKHPYVAAIAAGKVLHPRPNPAPGIHPTAVVDQSARISSDASVGAYAVIGARSVVGDRTVIHPHVVVYDGVTIGSDCVLHANSVVREGTIIGNDCQLQPGAVVGGEGFGYIPMGPKGHQRIPHIGITVLEDSVDIGANSTVDRATFGETRLKNHAKLDNLVMIGHNCVIGERAFLCSMVGLSGSTTVGDDVIFAGQAGSADHVKIGNRVRVAAKTGVVNDVPDGTDISGMPHQEATQWRREQMALRKLPDLLKKLRPILRELEAEQGEE